MSRPPLDFGPDGPLFSAHVRPWRDLVTELHEPARKAFNFLADRFAFSEGGVWLLDDDRSSLRAAAVLKGREVWDGEKGISLADAPRLRRTLEGSRRVPFPLDGSLWAPLCLFGSCLGFLEVRSTENAVPSAAMYSALDEAARALSFSVWRVSLDVQARRRDLHLRTLSEVGVLVHQSMEPVRLLEDAVRRLVRNLGLDRIKVYLWDARKRVFQGQVAVTLLDGVRSIGRDVFDPVHWRGDEAPRMRHAVPLSAAGETVGWLAVDNLLSHQEIAMDEIHLLGAVSGQLALALRNAVLFEDVEVQATTDELTHLLLGRVFRERLEEECRRAERTRDAFAVCMMDVDKFKTVNDTHGHPVGDRVLAGVAKKLKAVSRKMDVVARYAGDEFIALLPHATAEQAVRFARRVNENVRRLAVKGAGGAAVRPTVSIGVAVFPEHGTLPDELVRAADEALYQAKHAGRDGAALYSPLSKTP